jgi:Ca-activated chloride channel homolog
MCQSVPDDPASFRRRKFVKKLNQLKPIAAWSLLGGVLAACSSGASMPGVALAEDPGLAAPEPANPAAPGAVALPQPAAPAPQAGPQGATDAVSVPGITPPSATPTSNVGSTGAAGGATGAAAPPLPAEPAEEEGAVTEDADDEEIADPLPVEPSVSVNPFVDVAHDPLSTFAVDVDTASYDIFRRDVLNGYLPSPETVRLEEFINYFDYEYPAPEAGAEEPFSISLAAAPSLFDSGTTLLRVGIQGENPPEFEKKPANLVFLVDVSGSMQSPEKLPLVQSVLNQAVDVLEPGDTVSVVTYASGTGVALEPTPVSESDTITSVISGLTAGGSTNGASGIQLAYEQAREAFIEGGINHVVLCTDGDFNVGVSTTEGLIELIEEERRSGVTFTALGFGADNNDAMMEAVSNAGNGMYGVIANEDQATDYVYDRLLHNLTLIAKDVKIQVEFNPELVTAYRLLGYEDRAIADEDFRDDKVDAGEIGASHRVTALYELVLAGDEVPSFEGAPAIEDGEAYAGAQEVKDTDLVFVKVRYKDVDATEQDEAYEVGVGLAPAEIAGSAAELDADFQWAMGVATFAEVLKGSPYASPDLLPEVKSLIEPQGERDADRMEFNTLFDVAVSLLPEE